MRPIIRRAAEQTGEIVTLAAARRFSLVYVDQADPPHTLSPSWMGRPIPLHATSSGKVFLAWLPDQEREALLAGELESYTDRTITDHDVLDRELAGDPPARLRHLHGRVRGLLQRRLGGGARRCAAGRS